jgi:hypothetical protein
MDATFSSEIEKQLDGMHHRISERANEEIWVHRAKEGRWRVSINNGTLRIYTVHVALEEAVAKRDTMMKDIPKLYEDVEEYRLQQRLHQYGLYDAFPFSPVISQFS